MSEHVVPTRPSPGRPRPYHFPAIERVRLETGLTVAVVHVPGRPLAAADLVVRAGVAEERAETAGAVALAARALTEGTERRDAVALAEAVERLGASLATEAGWDAVSAGIDVPVARLPAALEILAEVVREPVFPEGEVDRLREERLNDLLQAKADPRRRADDAFAATVYAPESPYHRPAGGDRATVERLHRAAVRAAYRRILDPARMALVVAGDLAGLDVAVLAERLFGDWLGAPGEVEPPSPIVARSAVLGRRVRVVDRPGSVQTEIRIGHPGIARRAPDYHAVSVMAMILGGLFNSRLNMKLREEKGYTYGAFAGFDVRRGEGPFVARAAVATEVTVPAVLDMLTELDRMRNGPVRPAELSAARDFLVGVFPLRFETPGPIAGAVAGLHVHELPDEELTHYREKIEAVELDDVERAAREHLDLERLAVVLVGDADAFLAELEAAGIGPVEVEREPVPVPAVAAAEAVAEPGPVGEDGDSVGSGKARGGGEAESPASFKRDGSLARLGESTGGGLGQSRGGDADGHGRPTRAEG